MRDARAWLDLRPHLRQCLMEGRGFPRPLWEGLTARGVPQRDLGLILAPSGDSGRMAGALRTADRLGIGPAARHRAAGGRVACAVVELPTCGRLVVAWNDGDGSLLDVWPRRKTRLAAEAWPEG